jgi:hypothetical protein
MGAPAEQLSRLLAGGLLIEHQSIGMGAELLAGLF